MMDSNSSDREVRQGQGQPFLPPFPVQFASVFSYLRRYGIKFQASEKLLRSFSFVATHAHVDFSNVNRATGEQSSLCNEPLKQFVAPVPAVNSVDDDCAVEQACRSHLFGFAMAFDLLES